MWTFLSLTQLQFIEHLDCALQWVFIIFFKWNLGNMLPIFLHSFFLFLCTLFLEILYIHVEVFDSVWQISECHFIFLHYFFFLFLNMDNLSWHIYKFTVCFSSCSHLLLNFSSEFFISVIIFFNSRLLIFLL